MSKSSSDSERFWYFNEGTDRFAYRVLGARADNKGTSFAVWAPNASRARVVGDFNDWGSSNGSGGGLNLDHSSGVWSGTVDNAVAGHRYKYRLTTANGDVTDKADPFALCSEEPPATASIISDHSHNWSDQHWMGSRGAKAKVDAPVSIYEVHLGSWGRTVSPDGRFPNYRQIGESLAGHAVAHGFTHVELLPVMEHPFYGSWGYQSTGYFAPTARYGSPSDLMAMVDTLHQAGIGVILDWVPSHFPADTFALANFDGTALFEHEDPREGHHPDWDSSIFNYGRNEVRSFLVSSAISWLDRFHIDGLRVDAVASMLYRDYSRAEGEWVPNIYGGRENLEAIAFLRQLNEAVYAEFPDVQTFAEESTSFPGVTAATSNGGLGFGYKWDMGWMHDTLTYFRRDPVHRRWHHGELTFRSVYAFSENYTLPLSHDEVVHAKGSLLDQMPGDRWQQMANLRLLYGYQWSQPGKKLVFMGSELAPEGDWAHESVLDWGLHDADGHMGVRRWITELNSLYRGIPAMHVGDCQPFGFEWIDNQDATNSVLAYLRRDGNQAAGDHTSVLAVLNATPTPLRSYRLGVPVSGTWKLVANSDDRDFGGSGFVESTEFATTNHPTHGFQHSLDLTLPPLGILLLSPE